MKSYRKSSLPDDDYHIFRLDILKFLCNNRCLMNNSVGIIGRFSYRIFIGGEIDVRYTNCFETAKLM